MQSTCLWGNAARRLMQHPFGCVRHSLASSSPRQGCMGQCIQYALNAGYAPPSSDYTLAKQSLKVHEYRYCRQDTACPCPARSNLRCANPGTYHRQFRPAQAQPLAVATSTCRSSALVPCARPRGQPSRQVGYSHMFKHKHSSFAVLRQASHAVYMPPHAVPTMRKAAEGAVPTLVV